MSKLIFLLLLISMQLHAETWSEFFFGKVDPFEAARTSDPGVTFEYKVDNYQYNYIYKLVVATMRTDYTIFRSWWTGHCGVKGTRQVDNNDYLAAQLNKSQNTPIYEEMCLNLDRAKAIKEEVGSCPSGSKLIKTRGVETLTLNLDSSCKCYTHYINNGHVPYQDPKSKILYYNTSFRPYRGEVKNFVDFKNCQPFFEESPGQYDQIIDFILHYNHKADPSYKKNKVGKSYFTDILTGEEFKW